MTSIEECLFAHAETTPDKPALIDHEGTLSYRQLAGAVRTEAQRLKSQGLCEGDAILIRDTRDRHFVTAYLGAHAASCVSVPIEDGTPKATEEELRTLCSHAIIPPGTADVLFTTGTTGQRKGVMVSHRAIMADASNLMEAQGFREDTIFVVNGPLSHIGSLSKLYPVLLAGATAIILPGMTDMGAFFDALSSDGRRAATFLVPASIRMLLQFGSARLAALAPCIDFIETGAAPLSGADMEALCRLLPETRLYNTYASTETGIIATFNFNEGEPLPGCLGQPMSRSQLRITDEGHVACAGETLMTGYIGDEKLTREVMHDGWIVTSDLGRIDEKGRLRLEGRAGDTINLGGYKVAPTEVEEAVMDFEGIADCICLGIDSPIFGRCLRLLYSVKNGSHTDSRALARHLASRLAPYKVPRVYEQVDSIRRTFNGKLDRKSYEQ